MKMIRMGAKQLRVDDYQAYLELEAASEVKHEYHNGMLVAMAGGTPEHVALTFDGARSIADGLQRKGKSCQIFTSDLRIRIEAANRTFYPDISVVCGPWEKSDTDPLAIVNPTLIAEVLSSSSESFDRGLKFAHFRQLPSLREYLLISQQRVQVDVFFLTEYGAWEIRTFTERTDQLPLQSLDITISVGEIYRGLPQLTSSRDFSSESNAES